MSSSGSGFSQDQIEATYKVGKWISTPVSSIWLVGQVKRAFACYQRYHKDLASWDEACRTRARSVLADGYLHQPVSPRGLDMRSDYHIEGHIPRQLAEQVGKIGVERLAAGQRRDLAKALLAIVDQRRPLRKRCASQTGSPTSRGSHAWFEHGMRVDQPPEPLAPFHVQGPGFGRLQLSDRMAVSAALLVGLHATVLHQHPDFARIGNEAFHLMLVGLGGELRGLHLQALINSVEPAIPIPKLGISEPLHGTEETAVVLRRFVECHANQIRAAEALMREFGGTIGKWRGRVERAVAAAGGPDCVLRNAGVLGEDSRAENLSGHGGLIPKLMTSRLRSE